MVILEKQQSNNPKDNPICDDGYMMYNNNNSNRKALTMNACSRRHRRHFLLSPSSSSLVLVVILCNVLLIAPLCAATAEPLFLFAGQNNMNGHSSDVMSITKDSSIQDFIFDEWMESDYHTRSDLRDVLETAYLNSDDFDPSQTSLQYEIASRQAKFLGRMLDKGLTLKDDHEHAKCFHIDPSHQVAGQSDTVPVAPNSNCGASYGPELAFAHSLQWEMPYTIAKVAAGDTELVQHWMPPDGTYWEDLKNTIHNTAGEWQAFVWYQGESDCTAEQSVGYLEHLTTFLGLVRQEMFNANKDAGSQLWNSPLDVPIAIFQVGAWPEASAYKDLVRGAQQTFVDRDANSVLIDTDNLCNFKNMDAAALLIAGRRLWLKLVDLLVEPGTIREEPNVVDITTSPTPFPTESTPEPTKSPTESPVPDPTEAPTVAPVPDPTEAPTMAPQPTQPPLPDPTPRPTEPPREPDPTPLPTAKKTVPPTSSPIDVPDEIVTGDDDDYDDDDYDDDEDNAVNDYEDDAVEGEIEEEIEKELHREKEERIIEIDAFVLFVIAMIAVCANILCCGGVWACHMFKMKHMARNMFSRGPGIQEYSQVAPEEDPNGGLMKSTAISPTGHGGGFKQFGVRQDRNIV